MLRVEQRSPEADNMLNLLLDMAEEKLATAKEKASPKCPLRLAGLALIKLISSPVRISQVRFGVEGRCVCMRSVNVLGMACCLLAPRIDA